MSYRYRSMRLNLTQKMTSKTILRATRPTSYALRSPKTSKFRNITILLITDTSTLDEFNRSETLGPRKCKPRNTVGCLFYHNGRMLRVEAHMSEDGIFTS